MIKASCHCGNVQIEMGEKPESVMSCNCSVCGRLGAIWAYYDPAQVTITTEKSPAVPYRWGDEDIDFSHCSICGCVTHWASTENYSESKMAVNTRMVSRQDMEGIPVRMFDGADSWKTVEGHPGWGGF